MADLLPIPVAVPLLRSITATVGIAHPFPIPVTVALLRIMTPTVGVTHLFPIPVTVTTRLVSQPTAQGHALPGSPDGWPRRAPAVDELRARDYSSGMRTPTRPKPVQPVAAAAGRASPVVGMPIDQCLALMVRRIVKRGDCVDPLRKLPDPCVDLTDLRRRFPTGERDSNCNDEVFCGKAKEKHAFAKRHAGTAAKIDLLRPRCAELADPSDEENFDSNI